MGPWIIWMVSLSTPPITSLAPQNAQPRSDSVPGMVWRVGDGKEVARIFAVHLQIDVLLAFRNVLVAFQKYHWHG